jgi:hypothetical protein
MADIKDLQRRIDNVLSGRGKSNEFIGDMPAGAPRKLSARAVLNAAAEVLG